jgi:hypothetical protein
MEADEGAVSEEEPEGQGGDEFVQWLKSASLVEELDPGSLGEAERGVRRGMGEGVLPLPGDRYLGFQPGNQHNPRDEAQWDAILEAVKLFKQTHGRFPRSSGGDADETRLYKWLRNCSDTTMPNWTQERANKLALAFGDRWQSECFPNSIWPSASP